MLDYKLLQAFALVIMEGGFEKAARRLHLTQSAISQRVKQLEDQYGQILLKRTTPPEPTQAGLPLFVHYQKVYQLETDLYSSSKTGKQSRFTSLSLGINADSLATWFYEAVEDILTDELIVLDLHVDDQDRTHQFMQDGTVWACISTQKQALQGCRVTHLGRMQYGLFATEDFATKWFANGLTLEAFEQAPMARFNRKDDLNSRMFSLIIKQQPENPPTFFLPSTEKYGFFVSESRCYGIMPRQQSERLESQGMIINLSPRHWLDVHLYYHAWNLKSAVMERFSRRFIEYSQKFLNQ